MKNPTLEWARRYVAAGYEVLPLHSILEPAPAKTVKAFERGELPKKEAVIEARCSCASAECRSPGKHPRNPNGASGATLDLEQIAEWWGRWPDANIGLRMPPGRFAVDFDLYEPGVSERLTAFASTFGATAGAAAVQFSGGGEHHIFDGANDGFRFSTTLDGESGVDLIHNAHRYIVAAPSVHWTGRKYEWQSESLEPARAPAGLLERCGHGVGKKSNATKAKRKVGAAPAKARSKWRNVSVEDVPPAPCPPHVDPEAWGKTLALTLPPAVADGEEGSKEHGHAALMRVAGALVDGLCIEPARASAIAWECYNPRCTPPWTAKERRDFDRVFRKVAQSEATGRLLPAAQRPEVEDDAPDADDDSDPLEVLGTVADVVSELKPLDWLVHNVIAAGKVSVIVAQPAGGKSPLALWMALCIAAGRPIFDEERWGVRQSPILYLDFETGDLAVERLHRMCNALGVKRTSLDDSLRFVHADAALSVEVLEALHSAIELYGIGGVFIDTYASAVPGDIEASGSQFAHWLRQLGKMSRELAVPVTVLMHSKKGDSKSIEAISGHFGAAGAAQTIVQLVPASDEADAPIEVVCARHPRKKWEPFWIQWSDPTGPDTPKPGKAKRSYAGVKAEHDPNEVPWGLRVDVVSAPPGGRSKANDMRQDAARAEDAAARELIVAALKSGAGIPRKEAQRVALAPMRSVERVLRALLGEKLVRRDKGHVYYWLGGRK